jgi:hypothetical protein
MFTASNLQNIQLRKVTPAPNTTATLRDDIVTEKAQNARLRACDIEAWYASLREHTFATECVPLSPAEARALVALYRAKKQHGDNARGYDGVDAEQQELLSGLQQRIHDAMQALGGGGVFVKMSSRSPKDSAMCLDRASDAVHKVCTIQSDN